MTLLQLSNVDLAIEDNQLLKAVNLNVSAGELVVILGPNGAGKSSLLKVACGEITPSGGEVNYLGRSLPQLPLLEKAQKMAVLPQQSTLDFSFTVREVVALGRTPHSTGVSIDSDIVSQAIRLMDVERFTHHAYTHLSGGEKQRVQLARVLAQAWGEQGLLMLDEPTSALDFAHQQQVMSILKQRTAQGNAVLMVLHDLNLAASFADKIILMADGEICASGTPDEVLRESVLAAVFGLHFYPVIHPETGKRLFLN